MTTSSNPVAPDLNAATRALQGTCEANLRPM